MIGIRGGVPALPVVDGEEEKKRLRDEFDM